MSEERTLASPLPHAHEVVVPASPAVSLEDIALPLLTYVVQLGYLHFLLFGVPLVVLSARGGVRCMAGYHDRGRAVDLDFSGRDELEVSLFLSLIAYSAHKVWCAFSVELLHAGSDFVHLEYRGA